jgi:broad specificity phosphatase PhoE
MHRDYINGLREANRPENGKIRAMTILVIRHGETPSNAARILQTPDIPLSALGAGQALALARRLAAAGIARILASDMPRATMTAEPVALATGAPLEQSELLRERNFGDLRGRPFDTLGFDPLAMEDAPPGGESMSDFHARVDRAFAELVELRSRLEGPLAVITHGLVIRRILQRHAANAHGFEIPLRYSNTSVSILDAAPPYELKLVNCTAHLDQRHQDDGHGTFGV